MRSIEEVVSKIVLKILRSNPLYFPLTLKPTSVGLEPISIFLNQSDLLFRLIPRFPQRALIADEIGLGKTIEAILYARYLEELGILKRALIVVPRILITQWDTELQRSGVPRHRIFEVKREKVTILRDRDYPNGYYLVSIDLAKRTEYWSFIKGIEWDLIIVDEAHNIGIGTDREKFIRELIAKETKDLKPVLFLSATPHRGKAKDYLNMLTLLDPSLTEDIPDLDNSYFYQRTHNVLLYRRTKEVVNELEGERIFKPCNFYALAVEPTDAEKEFSLKLESFLRLKVREFSEDYVHSPEALLAVIVRKRASSSPKAAISTFESILKGMGKKVSEEFEKDTKRLVDEVFSTDFSEIESEEEFDIFINRFAENYSYVLNEEDRDIVADLLKLAGEIMTDDTKIKSTARILKNYLEKGQKVVVFTEYRDTLNYLKVELPKLLGIGDDEFETISGQDRDRMEEIKHKLSEENGKVKFLIATDVASEGLNLQFANVVINYEAPWSPIKLEQRLGRVWRIGQRKEVDVYTIFMAVRADLDVLENLYGKLMRINEALSEVKPLIGDKLTYAYRTTASYSGEFWTTANIEISEVEIAGKKKKISEVDLVLASITGKLRDFVAVFIKYANQLNEEISRKRVYPKEKASEIRDNLLKVSGVSEEEMILKKAEKVLECLGEIMQTGAAPKEVSARQVVKLLENKIQQLNKTSDFESLKYIIVPSKVQSLDFVAIVRLSINKKTLFEFPAIYVESSKRVLFGVSAIKYLKEVINRGGIPENIENLDILKKYNLEIGKYKVQSSVKDIFRELILQVSDYENDLVEKKLKLYRLWGNDYEWKTELLCHVIQVKGFNIQMGGDLLSKEEKERVEKLAMDYSMKYERRNRRIPKDVSGTESFDILSEDPSTGEKRYIEVKGHGDMVFYAELTPKEYETAKRLEKQYWLYLVINLNRSPVLLTFCDPVRNLKILKKIERVILGLPD